MFLKFLRIFALFLESVCHSHRLVEFRGETKVVLLFVPPFSLKRLLRPCFTEMKHIRK